MVLYFSGGQRLRFRTIIRLPTFERSAAGVLTEQEQWWLDGTLGQNPEAGPIIPGSGGVRKLRVALGGRGKSGGARVIYYYRGAKERVFLILAYAKGAKQNLTGAELQQMRKLTARLEAES